MPACMTAEFADPDPQNIIWRGLFMMQDKIQDNNILQFSTLIQSFVNNIQHNAANSKKTNKIKMYSCYK